MAINSNLQASSVHGHQGFEHSFDECVHELFEDQARRTPDAVAVVFERQSLTYADLNGRANQVAHYLRKLEVGCEVRVGICLERSLDMVTVLLAILKAGGVYVPIAPDYPAERQLYIVQDAEAAVVVTCGTKLFQARPKNPVIVDLRKEWNAICEESREDPGGDVDARSCAYIIYTSGTTGLPKGVSVEHLGLRNMVEAQRELFAVERSDRILQFAALTFDASIFEILMALAAGATLVLARQEQLMPGPELIDLIRTCGITQFTVPPSVLRNLPEAPLPSLRALIVAGEDCGEDLVRLWGQSRRFFNAYGPTEATVWASLAKCHPQEGRPSIGEPIKNVELYIVDQQGGLAPRGTAGELYIGGLGVGRGYRAKFGLTAEMFVPDAFSGRAGARLYRSGDLARYRADGMIEFLGRKDHQVKIRGFRIETSEIETALHQHPAVKESVVVAAGDASNKHLVAYWTRKAGNEENALGLREYLRQKLPPYMLPSAVVMLETLPLTPNGKIDRNALAAGPLAYQPAREFVAPQTETERLLMEICARILRLPQVSPSLSFIELGGSSLNATLVAAAIRESCSIELPLEQLLGPKTLGELARATTASSTSITALRSSTRTDGPIPASFSQERVWFLERMSPCNVAYNASAKLTFSGSLDVLALRRALGDIVERHEIYRTRFVEIEGQLIQVIEAPAMFALPDLITVQTREEVEEIFFEASRAPFSLSRLPLARWKLIRLEPDEHVLFIVEHHVIHDGWSFNVFLKELTELYRFHVEGGTLALDPAPPQFSDFVLWQREWIKTREAQEQLDYWKAVLDGAPPVLLLPHDRARPLLQTYKGETLRLEIDQSVQSQLLVEARRSQSTIFMLFAAALQVLLFRYSGQKDFCLGTGIANRRWSETQGLIGMLVNNIVLRLQSESSLTVAETIQRVKRTTLEAYSHQDVPFEKVVQVVDPIRDLRYNPIFQVLLSCHDSPLHCSSLPDVKLELEIGLGNGSAKFDLSVIVVPGSQPGSSAGYGPHTTMLWEYNSDLFDAVTVEQMTQHYLRILREIAHHSQTKISEIELLSEDERRQILYTWNRTEKEYPRDRCVHELFEEQAARRPAATAVVYGDQILSYGELNGKSNQLAWYLGRLGVGPEVRVGVCMERSPETIIVFLGILKAGGAYVPLDASYPPGRLGFMQSDARISVLLTDGKRPSLPKPGIREVSLDECWEDIGRESIASPRAPVTAENLSYVMYTSGSTGKPKGVAITHRNIVRLVKNTNYAAFNEAEVFLQFAPASFDAATFEIWGPLLNGGKLAVFCGGQASLGELGGQLRRHGVTTLWLTAGLFHVMVKERSQELEGVRQLLAGGDVLEPEAAELVAKHLPGCVLTNGYGPTEGTTFSCCYRVERVESGRTLPIGKPIANTQVYVLDEGMQAAPVGVRGELYIGGDGVGRGYWDQPALTAERFVPDPFHHSEGQRLYRTGDLVRWQRTGELEFLGRLDQQVKIRGFRIEPGEVESALREHADVGEAVVLAQDDGREEKQLAAYVVPRAGSSPESASLRRYLKTKLPDYMIPTIVWLDSIPLTPNGKVDPKSLPALKAQGGNDVSLGMPPNTVRSESVIPRDNAELYVATAFEEVLGVRGLSVKDHFFEVGGHSISALTLAARLSKVFQKDVEVRAVFEHPTIEQMATFLKLDLALPPTCLIPINPRGTLRPLFCVHDGSGWAMSYLSLARALGKERPLYGLQAYGLEKGQQALRSVEEMARQYIKEIQTVQAHGPYQLGGWCMGGTIAYEMAQQLSERGETISLLALFDDFAHPDPITTPITDQELEETEKRDRLRDLRKLFPPKIRISGLDLPKEFNLSLEEQTELIVRKLKEMGQVAQEETPERYRRANSVFAMNVAVKKRYHFTPFAGHIVLFRSIHSEQSDHSYQWRCLAQKGIEIHEFDIRHSDFMSPASSIKVGEVLKQYLEPDSIVGTFQTSPRTLEPKPV